MAFMLLTRIPAGWLAGTGPAAPARAVWAFPLAGAAIGAGGGLVAALCLAAGMPGPLASVWAVAAMVLLGEALHEDGLADIADGFGGGRSPARKLEIMRDSRIGSYGALALALAVSVRVLAIAALAAPVTTSAPALMAALAAAAALSRGSLAVPLLLLPPARADGLGASVGDAGWRRWACLALAAASALALLPPTRAGAAAGAALAGALAMSALARAQIGGYTGDVLGGCAVVAECAALSALACGT